MEMERKIFLYGNSVILGSIGASLRRCSQFDVMTLAMPLQEAPFFDDPKPGILLFDAEAPYTEDVFSLLKSHPMLLLIGINPGVNIIQVWRSHQMRGMSTQGLIDLIKRTDLPVSVE